MNKSLIAVTLLLYGVALWAQGPAANGKAAAAAQQAAPAAQPKKAVKAQDQDSEEAVVMIDSKADQDDEDAADNYGAEPRKPEVPGGLPVSYGQCKGVINEPGRSVLVFESPDDGEIYFVQVTVGKTKVSWKLIDSIRRSGSTAD